MSGTLAEALVTVAGAAGAGLKKSEGLEKGEEGGKESGGREKGEEGVGEGAEAGRRGCSAEFSF